MIQQSSYYFTALYCDCVLFDPFPLFCYVSTSDYFSLNVAQENVIIVHPQEGVRFNVPNSIRARISWPPNFPTSQVKVKLMIDGYLLDRTVSSEYITPVPDAEQDYFISVSSSYPTSTNYYLLLEFKCSAYVFCETARSRTFAVNYNPRVVTTLPIYDSVVYPSATATVGVQWTSPSLIGETLRLQLRRVVPVIWDFPYGVMKPHVVTTSGTQANSLSVAEGWMTGLYVNFRWNCMFSSWFCDQENSPIFHAPQLSVVNWNYPNPVSKPIWESSCTILKAEGTITPPTLPGKCWSGLTDATDPVCEFCNNGGDFEAALTCEDCYITSSHHTQKIDFSFSNGRLNWIRFEIDGEFFLTADFLLTLSGSFKWETSKSLFATGIPNIGFAVQVAGFDVQIGGVFDVIAYSSIDVVRLVHGFSQK